MVRLEAELLVLEEQWIDVLVEQLFVTSDDGEVILDVLIDSSLLETSGNSCLKIRYNLIYLKDIETYLICLFRNKNYSDVGGLGMVSANNSGSKVPRRAFVIS